MLRGAITQEKNGKISLAGPMTNIILAIIFLGLLFVFGSAGALVVFLSFGLTINALLGAFNMIPFGLFDGAKILRWNRTIYFISLGVALVLLFISFI